MWKFINKKNKKEKFSFNDDKTKINQWHSVDIKLEPKRTIPPDVLLHGTSIDNKEEILKNGLNNVNLTDDYDVAFNLGIRYAKYNNKTWIIHINAKKMNQDGYEFLITENNTYLTDHVPSKYFLK